MFRFFQSLTFNLTIIRYTVKSIGLVFFNLNLLFDKICEKQTQKSSKILYPVFSTSISLSIYVKKSYFKYEISQESIKNVCQVKSK